MFIKLSLISLAAISLILTNCVTSNPVETPTSALLSTPTPVLIPTPVPTPTATSTPVWTHEVTHYDGDLLPALTYAGSDNCEYNEQLSFSAICLEILSYGGVSKEHRETALLAISAIASKYPNSQKEITVDWPYFGPSSGKQNYLAFVLWHDKHSDTAVIIDDICVFMRVLPETSDSCGEWANELLSESSVTNGAMTGSAGKIHNGSISIIPREIWDKPIASLGNIIEEPFLAYDDPRRILAHEYFHTYQSLHYIHIPQRPLGDLPSFGPMWLLEGSSEYASSRVGVLESWMDWNGHVDYRINSVKDLLIGNPRYQDLSHIETMTQLNEIIDTDDVLLTNMGRVLVYDLGFLAVSYAISISNHDSVMMDYWDDLVNYGAEKSFERNIGITVEEFYVSFSDFLVTTSEEQKSIIYNQVEQPTYPIYEDGTLIPD